MKTLLVACLLVASFGCSTGLFNKTSQKEGMTVAEKLNHASQANLERVIEGQKEQPRPTISPTINIRGASNQVAVKIEAPVPPPQAYKEFTGYGTKTNQKVTTAESYWSDYRNTLPMGMAMILVAIGGFMLLKFYRKAKSESMAFNAFSGMVESQTSHWLDELNDQMAQERDADKISRMSVDRASLEKFRGKIAEHKAKSKA